MKSVACVLLMCFPYLLIAQTDPDALMKIASVKALEAKSFEYDFLRETYFAGGNFVRQKSSIISKKSDDRHYPYQKISGTRYTSFDNRTARFDYVTDEKQSALIDHEKKTLEHLFNDMSTMAKLSVVAMHVGGAYFDYFHRENPLSYAPTNRYTLTGELEYGGTLCYEITTLSGKNQSDTFHWYIAKKDSLPRGYRHSKGKTEVFLKKVDFAPPIGTFTLDAPEGYKRIQRSEKNLPDIPRPPKSAGSKGIAFPVGSILPTWEATDFTGKRWSAKALEGRVAVLDFWGTWCIPCLKTMPKLQQLYETFQDQGLVIIGFDVKDDREKLGPFLKRNGYSYTMIPEANQIAAEFQISTFPSLYIIDKQGKVIHAESGYRSNALEEWKAKISTALKD